MCLSTVIPALFDPESQQPTPHGHKIPLFSACQPVVDKLPNMEYLVPQRLPRAFLLLLSLFSLMFSLTSLERL